MCSPGRLGGFGNQTVPYAVMRLEAFKIEELGTAGLVGWKPAVIYPCGSAAQTKRLASGSYHLKTTVVVSLRLDSCATQSS